MSLLLDARKKQLAQGGHDKHAEIEFSLEEQPNGHDKFTTPDDETCHDRFPLSNFPPQAGERANEPLREFHVSPAMAAPDRQPIKNILDTGHDLFDAKSPGPSASRMGINRNMLFALCGTIATLAAGAGYYWHDGSMGNTQLPRPDMSAPLLRPVSSATTAEPETRNTLSAKTAYANSAYSVTKPLLAIIAPPVKNKTLPAPAPQASGENSAIHIERNKTGFTGSLPDNAYLAYRNGNLEVAQRLYRELLDGDERNTDALLGLAVIAQQRGEDALASQYYSRALALDPHNAVANAGMSILAMDDSSESRLKALLDEQKDSATLHFALGNRYAEQSRWGEAQQTYFNAYTLEPGNAELAFNLAVSLDHLGQDKLAAQYYQRALELDQVENGQEPHQKFDHAQARERIRELAR